MLKLFHFRKHGLSVIIQVTCNHIQINSDDQDSTTAIIETIVNSTTQTYIRMLKLNDHLPKHLNKDSCEQYVVIMNPKFTGRVNNK